MEVLSIGHTGRRLRKQTSYTIYVIVLDSPGSKRSQGAHVDEIINIYYVEWARLPVQGQVTLRKSRCFQFFSRAGDSCTRPVPPSLSSPRTALAPRGDGTFILMSCYSRVVRLCVSSVPEQASDHVQVKVL